MKFLNFYKKIKVLVDLVVFQRKNAKKHEKTQKNAIKREIAIRAPDIYQL